MTLSAIISFFMLLLMKPTIGSPFSGDISLHSKRTERVGRAFPIQPDPSTAPFLIENEDTGTSLELSISGLRPELIVVYPINPKGLTYADIHVWVGFGKPPSDFGRFPYTIDHHCFVIPEYSIAQCTIPISDFTKPSNACGKTFNIATQADMSNGEVGTAGDKCIRKSCTPWFKYFTFTFTC